MKLAERILNKNETKITIKVPSNKEGEEVEVIKNSPKTNLAVVIVTDKKGTGRFGIVTKVRGKKVSPLYKAEEIEGNAYREKKLPVGDSVYHKFDSEKSALEEISKLKRIFPNIAFDVEEWHTAALYSITHVPTGYAVLKSKTKSHALEALKLIEKEGIVFPDSSDPKEVTNKVMGDKETKEKLFSILSIYHMRAK